MVERMAAYLDSSQKAAAMVSRMDEERAETMVPWTASTQAEAMALFSAQWSAASLGKAKVGK